MKFIWILFLLVVFVLVVFFSVLNSELIVLDFIWGRIQVPLAIPLIVMFVFGALVGALFAFFRNVRKKIKS
jgi:uncharacterized integral membrane protein